MRKLLLVAVVVLAAAAVTAPLLATLWTAERLGVVHAPTPGDEVFTWELEPPEGSYDRVVLELDVTVGPWQGEADGRDYHSGFWLHRGKRWSGNVIGYSNLRRKGQLRLTHNLGSGRRMQAAQERIRFQPEDVPGHWIEGTSYHLRYFVDAGAGTYVLELWSRDTTAAVEITGAVPIEPLEVDKPWRLVLGHPAHNAGPEQPSYGWTYSNARVALLQTGDELPTWGPPPEPEPPPEPPAAYDGPPLITYRPVYRVDLEDLPAFVDAAFRHYAAARGAGGSFGYQVESEGAGSVVVTFELAFDDCGEVESFRPEDVVKLLMKPKRIQ